MSSVCFTALLCLGSSRGEMATSDAEKEASSSSKENGARRRRYISSRIKCFGVDLSPDNVAVAMVYFVQGVLGLSKLAVSFYLKDDLHLDPAEVCFFFVLFCF